MMGGDPSLARLLQPGKTNEFWARSKKDLDKIIRIIAVNLDSIEERYPDLEVFYPKDDQKISLKVSSPVFPLDKVPERFRS